MPRRKACIRQIPRAVEVGTLGRRVPSPRIRHAIDAADHVDNAGSRSLLPHAAREGARRRAFREFNGIVHVVLYPVEEQRIGRIDRTRNADA